MRSPRIVLLFISLLFISQQISANCALLFKSEAFVREYKTRSEALVYEAIVKELSETGEIQNEFDRQVERRKLNPLERESDIQMNHFDVSVSDALIHEAQYGRFLRIRGQVLRVESTNQRAMGSKVQAGMDNQVKDVAYFLKDFALAAWGHENSANYIHEVVLTTRNEIGRRYKFVNGTLYIGLRPRLFENNYNWLSRHQLMKDWTAGAHLLDLPVVAKAIVIFPWPWYAKLASFGVLGLVNKARNPVLLHIGKWALVNPTGGIQDFLKQLKSNSAVKSHSLAVESYAKNAVQKVDVIDPTPGVKTKDKKELFVGIIKEHNYDKEADTEYLEKLEGGSVAELKRIEELYRERLANPEFLLNLSAACFSKAIKSHDTNASVIQKGVFNFMNAKAIMVDADVMSQVGVGKSYDRHLIPKNDFVNKSKQYGLLNFALNDHVTVTANLMNGMVDTKVVQKAALLDAMDACSKE